MTTPNWCPLLGHPASSVRRIGTMDAYVVDCPVCGRYSFSGSLGASLESISEDTRRAVSWYARERAEHGEPIPELTTINIDEIAKSMADLPVLEKANRLLRAYATRSTYPGSPIPLENMDQFASLVRARSKDEVKYLSNYLVEAKHVDRRTDGKLIVSVAGWQHLQREKDLRAASRRAFVAMWFDPSLDAAFEAGFRRALEDVNLEAIRIDRIHHNEKICDKIIAEIRDCGVVIADFSGHRQGVYFEAGFALGLGKPVIWCCRKSDLDDAHFDTRQYNHLVWSTPDELREKLRERLRATVLPHLRGAQATS